MDELNPTPATHPAVLRVAALESNHLQNTAEAAMVGSHHSGAWHAVEAWHNVTHAGAFRFCTEQPCHALNYRRWGR